MRTLQLTVYNFKVKLKIKGLFLSVNAKTDFASLSANPNPDF